MFPGNARGEVRLDRSADALESSGLHGEIIEIAKPKHNARQCGRHGRLRGIRIERPSIRSVAMNFTMKSGFYLRSGAIKDNPIPAAGNFHNVESVRLQPSSDLVQIAL